MNDTGRILRFKIRKSPLDVDAALQYVVRSAYRDVSFYRRTWESAGAALEAFHGVRDMAQLPVTRKGDLLLRGLEDRLSRRVRPERTVSRVTSGMSGANLEVHMTRGELAFRQLLLASRMWHDAGRALPLTIVQAGAWIPPENHCEVQTRRTLLGPVTHISRRLPISAQIEALMRSRPTVLTGCPSCLEILASDVARLGIDGIRPKIIATRGEILRPQVRGLLSEVFGCRVTDYYSAEEIGLIAWQCPDHSGIMHVNRDACVLEILDDEGRPAPPGQEGNVVATSLFNTTAPIIRYALGDRSATLCDPPASCRCGSEVQSILTPTGRSDDLLVLPDNRRMSPRVVDDLVYLAFAAVGLENRFNLSLRDYQIVQDTQTQITVRLLTDCVVPSIVPTTLDESVRALHPDFRCEVVSVRSIDPEESGKRKRVISHVR